MELLIKVKKNTAELVLKEKGEKEEADIGSKRLLRELFLKLEKLAPNLDKSSLEKVKVQSTDDSSQMSLRVAKAFREGFKVGP